MPQNPTIDRSVVGPIVGAIAEITGQVDELLDDSGLSRHWADPSVNELPEERVWHLFESASRQHACPEIGLYAGGRLTVSDLGPFGIQLENCLTLHQCLNNYIETVSQYSSHARFWLEHDGDSLWFCRQGIDLISRGRDQVEQFTVQLMSRIVQLATDEDWIPSALRIQAESDHAFRESRLFDGTKIESGHAATSIRIPSFPGLQSIQWGNDAELAKQVCRLFTQGAKRFCMDIDDVAEELRTSRRTLQRRLADHGLDWSRLVERCRFHQAAGQLAESDVPLIELAHELGYTDQANFGRAFRNWTGMSPGNWRRLRQCEMNEKMNPGL